MRSFSLVLALFGFASHAAAQGQGHAGPAPAAKPVADSGSQGPPVVVPPPPAPPPEPPATPTPTPAPESAPASEKTPEEVAPVDATPPVEPIGRPKEVAPQARGPESIEVPWIRAHEALTLEGRLGFVVRPESSAGFDEESHLGSELGLSLYWDLKRELAVGLELERATLGRGTALSGASSVSVDYSVTSASLGFRAYPKRTELFDLYVGLQVGLGIQGVSAGGTLDQGLVTPPMAYKCSGSASPAFQLGGGVGARLMLSPRWGVGARINATGRALTSDVVDDCAQGLGTATTVSASLGLGYDFDLDP